MERHCHWEAEIVHQVWQQDFFSRIDRATMPCAIPLPSSAEQTLHVPIIALVISLVSQQS